MSFQARSRVDGRLQGILNMERPTGMTNSDVSGLPDNFVLRAPFFHRDMMHWLRKEFGTSDYKGSFVLKAEEQRKGDSTTYIMRQKFKLVLVRKCLRAAIWITLARACCKPCNRSPVLYEGT